MPVQAENVVFRDTKLTELLNKLSSASSNDLVDELIRVSCFNASDADKRGNLACHFVKFFQLFRTCERLIFNPQVVIADDLKHHFIGFTTYVYELMRQRYWVVRGYMDYSLTSDLAIFLQTDFQLQSDLDLLNKGNADTLRVATETAEFRDVAEQYRTDEGVRKYPHKYALGKKEHATLLTNLNPGVNADQDLDGLIIGLAEALLQDNVFQQFNYYRLASRGADVFPQPPRMKKTAKFGGGRTALPSPEKVRMALTRLYFRCLYIVLNGHFDQFIGNFLSTRILNQAAPVLTQARTGTIYASFATTDEVTSPSPGAMAPDLYAVLDQVALGRISEPTPPRVIAPEAVHSTVLSEPPQAAAAHTPVASGRSTYDVPRSSMSTGCVIGDTEADQRLVVTSLPPAPRYGNTVDGQSSNPFAAPTNQQHLLALQLAGVGYANAALKICVSCQESTVNPERDRMCGNPDCKTKTGVCEICTATYGASTPLPCLSCQQLILPPRATVTNPVRHEPASEMTAVVQQPLGAYAIPRKPGQYTLPAYDPNSAPTASAVGAQPKPSLPPSNPFAPPQLPRCQAYLIEVQATEPAARCSRHNTAIHQRSCYAQYQSSMGAKMGRSWCQQCNESKK